MGPGIYTRPTVIRGNKMYHKNKEDLDNQILTEALFLCFLSLAELRCSTESKGHVNSNKAIELFPSL